jgi:hypothetical protein
MAGSVSNIIVGAAQVFISKKDSTVTGGQPQNMPVFGATGSAATFLGTAPVTDDWRDVGYTSEGFEISYEPTYGEVEVDQLLDSARIFKTQLRVMLRTSMNEGTLENVRTAFGQSNTTQLNSVYSSPTARAAASGYGASNTGQNVLGLAAGALGEKPVERSLIAVGPGPAVAGSNTERVYLARRVLSMETVSHALRRNESTVYPVTFRCLPADNYSNAEYGEILDRVYS